MRKALSIDGEGSVLLLVINVEINHVGRNLPLAKFTSHLPYPRLGVVAVAALLIAQRKQRWKWHSPRQCREIADHPFRIRPVEEVVVQFSPVGAEGVCVPKFFPKVKAGSVRVVDKNSVRFAVPHAEKKRNVLV